MKLRIVLFAVGALCALPATAGAAERCHPKGSTAVVESAYARVYRLASTPRYDYPPAYACNKHTGRRREIGDSKNEGILYGPGFAGDKPELRGRFLLYSVNYEEGAGDYDTLELLDLRTFRHRRFNSECNDVYDELTSFFLRATGAVACSRRSDTGGEILVATYGNPMRVIDSGEAVDAFSLQASSDRTTLTWRSGETEKSAPFR